MGSKLKKSVGYCCVDE